MKYEVRFSIEITIHIEAKDSEDPMRIVEEVMEVSAPGDVVTRLDTVDPNLAELKP